MVIFSSKVLGYRMNEDITEQSIRNIIKEILNGQENRFEELIHLYQNRVFMIISRFSRDEDERREIAHVVFIKIFKNLKQFKGTAPFEHWVSRIALRTAYDTLRKRKKNIEYQMSCFSNEEVHWLEQHVDQRQIEKDQARNEKQRAQELLNKALDKLKAEQKWMIEMAEIRKISLKEIARKMGWSYTSTKVKAHRARIALQKVILNSNID